MVQAKQEGPMINLSIPGQMTEGELRGIEFLSRKVPPAGCVVETGSLYGLSSYTWATSVDPTATVYCIDPWVREPWIIDLVEKSNPNCPRFGLEAFREYTKECSNIVSIPGYSPATVRNWREPVDIFFDDSMHHNPFFRRNLRFWLRHMKPGGTMCGHDYCEQWPDVVKEVNKLACELDVKVHVRQWLWWIDLPAKMPYTMIRWKRRLSHG
jgi:Methyltransferase domain